MKLKTGRHTSALKEARKNKKRRLINRAAKSRIKTAVKKFNAAVEAQEPAKAADTLKQAMSLLDKAAKKNIIHKNTKSRKISRLSSKLTKKKQ